MPPRLYAFVRRIRTWVTKYVGPKFALMEEGIAASGAENHLLPNERNSAPKEDNNLGEQPQGAGSKTQRSPSWLKGRDRLLNLIFKWKTEEAWREVVLVCGAETGLGGSEGLRSSCEVEVRLRFSGQDRTGQDRAWVLFHGVHRR